MRSILIFFFSSIIVLSCQTQEKFDKIKWQTKEDPAFPPQSRTAMLKDLQSNYNLMGISRSQLVQLLGQPDYADDSTVTYNIIVHYGNDIDPVYTKNLDIKLNNDKTNAVSVSEWRK